MSIPSAGAVTVGHPLIMDDGEGQAPRWVYVGATCIGILAIAACLTGVLWARSADGSARYEASILVISTLTSLVLSGVTLAYVSLTRALLREAELSRRSAVLDREARAHSEFLLRIDAAMSSMLGASNDVLAAGTHLSGLLRARRAWRAEAIRPLNDALARVATGLDQLRRVAPGLSDEAGTVFDVLLEYQAYASRGASEDALNEIAGRLREAKLALESAAANLAAPIP
jgi:hypothetical protein